MVRRQLVTMQRVIAILVAVPVGALVYWLLSPTTCGESYPPVCEREYGGLLEIGIATAVACVIGLLVLSALERFEREA